MIESGKMKLTPRQVFLGTLVLYGLLWFVPDKRIAMVAVAGFCAALVYRERSFPVVLIVSVLALSPLLIGKQFAIELVGARELGIPGRPFGITADVTVTWREIIAAAMLVLLWRHVGWRTLLPDDRLSAVLFALPLALHVSSILGSVLPAVSLAHSVFFWEPYIAYRFVRTFGGQVRLPVVRAAFAGAVVSGSVLAVLQTLHGSPFGRVIEYIPDFVPVDMTPDMGGAAYRFGGMFPYANAFAHYLLFSVLLLVPSLFDRKGESWTAVWAVMSGSLALLMTLSRSAWIGFAAGLLFFLYAAEKRWGMQLRPVPFVRTVVAFLAVPVAVFGAFAVLPRLAGTLYTFDTFGSVRTREILLSYAWDTVRAYPLFGVGLELWAYDMYLRYRSVTGSVFTYFPEPVHNGLFKLIVESGIVGFVPYLLVLVTMARNFASALGSAPSSVRLHVLGLAAAAVAVMINVQMQPVLPDLTLFAVFVALYGNRGTIGSS